MSVEHLIEEKVYAVTEGRNLSMKNLLEYFTQYGSLRVSDLHLKVGTPPTYRVDGQLQKMKGLPLEAEKWANHPTAFFDKMKRLQQDRQQKK